jgi:hypothetical protein
MPDPGEELARRKEIWNLTRYLMAEHPLIRDGIRFSYANPGRPFETEAGVRRVIKVEGGISPAGRQEFWVLDGHQVTTTTELPDWAGSVPQEVYRPRRTGPSELIGRLEEMQAEFPQGDANLPPVGPAELAAWYEPMPEADAMAKTTETLADIVGISLAELHEVLASADASRSWADAALERLTRSHAELRVMGAQAAELVAVLLMIANARQADRYLCLGTVGVIASREPLAPTLDPVGSVEGLIGGGLDAAALIVPSASFGAYASSFAIEDVVESIALANLVAAKLRKQGDETLDRCREITAVTLYFPLLAQALLWYLAAATAFRFGDHFYRYMAPDETERLHAIERELVLCEERRAVIEAALMRPAGLGGFNPDTGDRDVLWGWVLALRDIDLEDAELEVHELALQLIIPRFVRDIVLGFLRLGSPQQFDAGVALLQRAIARQKRDAPQHLQLWAETNYVAFAYDLLIFGAGEADRTEEQANFEVGRDAWVDDVKRLRRR